MKAHTKQSPKRSAEEFSMRSEGTQTADDVRYATSIGEYFNTSIGTTTDKLRNFTKYVPRQSLSSFLAKSEIFGRIVSIHGHIIECGVFLGGGLMTWAQLSAIHEPINHTRRIVGFDTFTGFVSLGENDRRGDTSHSKEGGLASHADNDIRQSIALYDLNRPIGHIPRVELVKGDACQTIPEYIAANRHLVVALLYLDFDLYEPTKTALQAFIPRMPKGAVVAFDELNQKQWPGETLAAVEYLGLNKLRLQRFPYVPQLSYAVLE